MNWQQAIDKLRAIAFECRSSLAPTLGLHGITAAPDIDSEMAAYREITKILDDPDADKKDYQISYSGYKSKDFQMLKALPTPFYTDPIYGTD